MKAMRNQVLLFLTFLLISNFALAQPSLRNHDMIKIADTRRDEPLESDHTKIDGNKVIAVKRILIHGKLLTI